MTFLEYVARHCMGPPVSGKTWHCPFHDDHSPSFSLRRSGKFKCYACGKWGDEFDLLKRFYPNDNYPRRQERACRLHLQYQTEQRQGAGADKAATTNHHRGGGDMEHKSIVEMQGSKGDVGLAFANWNDAVDEPLGLIEKMIAVCDGAGCSVQDLVDYCHEFHTWVKESEERHLQSCDDPDCEDRVCVANRAAIS